MRTSTVGVPIAQPVLKKDTAMAFQLWPAHFRFEIQTGQWREVSYVAIQMSVEGPWHWIPSNTANHSLAKYCITGLQEMEVSWTGGQLLVNF